mgnify:CR=1 FL=1
MKRILGFALLALLMLSLPAFAAGPTDTTPPSTTGAKTNVRSGFAGKSETTITGMVVGEDGRPMLDVNVKLYMGGLLVTEQLTSSDGSFEFTELIDYGIDVTIDLWFVPPTDDLVMENVSVEIDKWSEYPGGQHDLRPYPDEDVNRNVLRDQPTAGFFVKNATDVTLRECRVTWGPNRQEYFRHALESHAAPGLRVENFRGEAAWPERDRAVVELD